MRSMVAALAVVCLGAAAVLQASDRVGIYGVIDNVVFEPNANTPERVQLWGAFAVATRGDSDHYDAVKRGYLYYNTGDSRSTAVREWNDLKGLANGKTIVAFSSRFGQSVRVRSDQEKPQTPDAYVTGIGLQTIRPDREYAPIQALASIIRR